MCCEKGTDMHKRQLRSGAAIHLYSSLASQGVFVSTMLPLKISLPMMSAAAFGARLGAEEEKLLQRICWLDLCLVQRLVFAPVT